MKKQIIIFGIIFVLIIIGLTGCFDDGGDNGSSGSGGNIVGDTDKIEIYEYKQFTLGPYIPEENTHAWAKEGLFYNDTVGGYHISAYARNIGEETIDIVYFYCRWYDISNNLLHTDLDSESNFGPGSTYRLSFALDDHNDLFPDIHHVIIDVDVT